MSSEILEKLSIPNKDGKFTVNILTHTEKNTYSNTLKKKTGCYRRKYSIWQDIFIKSF